MRLAAEDGKELAPGDDSDLVEGWRRVESRTRMGEYSYENTETKKRTSVKPIREHAPSPPALDMYAGLTADSPFRVPSYVEEIEGKRSVPVQHPHAPYDVFLYMQIKSFGNISVTEQSFKAYFYLKAAWVETRKQPNELLLLKKRLKKWDGEDRNWPDGIFNPKLDFMNADPSSDSGDGLETEGKMLKVCDWRFGPKGEPVIEYSFNARGTFIEALELQDFPFDVQPLRISISSSKDVNFIRLREDKFMGVQSTLRPEFLANPEFDIQPKMKLGNGETVVQPVVIDARGDADLESEVSGTGRNSRPGKLGQSFSVVHFAIIGERIPNYYIFNVLMPTFLITCMEGGAFVIDAVEAADRFSVTLTLTLVAAAYK